jgi:hypothetical protein
MAMAEPGKHEQPHTGDYIAYAARTEAKKFAINDACKAGNVCSLPTKKQSKIRTRFRAVSYFRISPVETTAPVRASFPVSVPILQYSRTGHIPPFYYVFLFRLTPF